MPVKGFIKAALADGKTLEVKKILKDKYAHGDKNVLPDNCFKTEYRLNFNDTEHYPITKTAYDYGVYIQDSKARAADKLPIAEQLSKAKKQVQRGEALTADKKSKNNER